jgi:hypothetical protein
VDKSISVERTDSAFLLLFCKVFSGFYLLSALIFFKNEGQRLLSGYIFDFKSRLFLLFEIANCSVISSTVVVILTIMTLNVGRLSIFRRLAYTTGKRFLIIKW